MPSQQANLQDYNVALSMLRGISCSNQIQISLFGHIPRVEITAYNKTLELTPGMLALSAADLPMNSRGCAVVGGAAELYVRRSEMEVWSGLPTKAAAVLLALRMVSISRMRSDAYPDALKMASADVTHHEKISWLYASRN